MLDCGGNVRGTSEGGDVRTSSYFFFLAAGATGLGIFLWSASHPFPLPTRALQGGEAETLEIRLAVLGARLKGPPCPSPTAIRNFRELAAGSGKVLSLDADCGPFQLSLRGWEALSAEKISFTIEESVARTLSPYRKAGLAYVDQLSRRIQCPEQFHPLRPGPQHPRSRSLLLRTNARGSIGVCVPSDFSHLLKIQWLACGDRLLELRSLRRSEKDSPDEAAGMMELECISG